MVNPYKIYDSKRKKFIIVDRNVLERTIGREKSLTDEEKSVIPDYKKRAEKLFYLGFEIHEKFKDSDLIHQMISYCHYDTAKKHFINDLTMDGKVTYAKYFDDSLFILDAAICQLSPEDLLEYTKRMPGSFYCIQIENMPNEVWNYFKENNKKIFHKYIFYRYKYVKSIYDFKSREEEIKESIKNPYIYNDVKSVFTEKFS
jgi:hypothetical protein